MIQLKFIHITYILVLISSFEISFSQNNSNTRTKEVQYWNFDDKNTSRWKLFDKNKKEIPIVLEKTPFKSNLFLGKLSNNTAAFSVYNLTEHDSITISFDIYIIGTWDGNDKTYGQDVFMLKIDSNEYIKTSFSNTTFTQSYPELNIGNKSYKAKTGARAINKLGFTWKEHNRYDGIMDAVYSITLTVPHHNNSTDILFSCTLRDSDNSLYNESWGLDNVTLLTKSICRNIIDYHIQGDSILNDNDSVIITVNSICDTCLWSNGFRGKNIVIKQEGIYKFVCSNSNGCNFHSREITIRRKKKLFPIKGR